MVSIILSINGKQYDVSYDSAMGSELIKERTDSLGLDCIIPFPCVDELIAWNYINFLTNTTQPETITDAEKLKLCFVMETYFVDIEYFKYLMQQMFNNWNMLSTVIYNEPNLDIQRRMFLLCPYEFIRHQQCITNPNFYKQWLEYNKNIVVIVNGNERYHTQLKYDTGNIMKCLFVCHTVDSKHTGFSQETYFYPSGNIECQRQYFNEKKQGMWRDWYDNEHQILKYEQQYVDNKRHGMHTKWYDNENHTVLYQGLYINDKKQGPWKHYYDNKQQTLWYEVNYVDDVEQGTSSYWYNNQHHTLRLECVYVNGSLRQQIEYDEYGKVMQP